ncbi:hypothetical protein PENSTE_c011G01604 [Penicillium steckii]|uniref:Major facilitator superfamily (MFS) profile domain-containing protein n=1 Tax=Penicillium steckii TaxID=303698 RepID=A0A1V6T670_9EURO|nr:hypothetical protein PENSTE_c011G01604 [Penicillium steckii]
MALSMVVTAAGPQFAPTISGFIANVSWRWIFWVSLILAVVTLVPVVFLPETYEPVLNRDSQKGGEGILAKAFTRPVYMIVFMYFEAYPLIFQDIYGMSDGIAGLAFLPIALGAAIGMLIFLGYDHFLYRAKS